MKKKEKIEKDGMRVEYDFSKGVQGKHAGKFQDGHTTIIYKKDGSTEIKITPPRKGR